MFHKVILAVVVGAFVLSGSVRADDAAKKKKAAVTPAAEAFKKLDANNDGKLTQEEFKNIATVVTIPKAKKGAAAFDAAAAFKKLDKNEDGKLTAEEYAGVATVLPMKKAK
jgi:Ca2+-binding EF-hand superfamily protein